MREKIKAAILDYAREYKLPKDLRIGNEETICISYLDKQVDAILAIIEKELPKERYHQDSQGNKIAIHGDCHWNACLKKIKDNL